MKRFLLTSFVWVVCLLMIVAAPVNEQAAKQTALDFMKRQMSALTRGEVMELTRAVTGVADGDDAGIYVFNAQKGFVVISANDDLPAVLAYSNGEPYDAKKAPEAMKLMLKAYHTAATTKVYTRADVPTHDNVAPLTKTMWDQNAPYNKYCPSGCPTGCVATAMAQVMYYHKCPASYDWDKMNTSYSSTDTGEAADAVARLMSDVGEAVFMEYTVSGSSAYNLDACEALRYDFGYAETTEYVQREAFTAQAWDALVYGELAASRPVILGASSISSANGNEGHAFILDGYEVKSGTGYYHINWGWGGRSDDYFLLSVLNPSNQYTGGNAGSSGYSIGQTAIIGIQPAETPMEKTTRLWAYNVHIDKDKGTYTRTSTSDDFPALVMYLDCYNNAKPEAAREYDIAIALYKGHELVQILDQAPLKAVVQYVYGTDALGYRSGILNLDADVSFGSGLADGTYQLRVLSRESGKTDWAWAFCAVHNYVEVVISGTTMKTTTYGLPRTPEVSDFTINSVNVSGSKKVGEPLKITINLTDKNQIGNMPIYLWGNASLSAGSDSYQLLTGGGCNLDPNETGEMTLEYTPQRAGEFKFILSGSMSKYDTPLYTFTENISGMYLLSELIIDDSEPQPIGLNNLSGTTLKGVARIYNYGSDPFDDNIYLDLGETASLENKFSLVSNNNVKTTIAVGQSVDLPINITDLKANYYYVLLLSIQENGKKKYLNADENGYFNYSNIYHTGEDTGIGIIPVDTPDADVYNMQGVRLGKASGLKTLPKGLYIINKKKIINR